MQFGCCSSADMAGVVKAAGYDYLECAVTSLLAGEDDAAFAPVLATYRALPLPTPVFNIFLPRDLKIVGPLVDEERIKVYVQRAIARVQLLGGKIIIFGSGGSRTIPDGFSRSDAMQQIVAFLHTVADAAVGSGVTVSIEALNRGECNVLNSVAEAAELARQVNRPSISAMADLYHMMLESELLEHMVTYKDWIKHIHVADTDRQPPGSGQYPYTKLARLLEQIGYTDRVSVECRWTNMAAEAGPALQYMRKVF